MDDVPDIVELTQYVQLPSKNRINKLARRLKIFIDNDIKDKAKERLELVFREWIATKATEATRRNMIETLIAIKENEVADTYYSYIISVQQRKQQKIT